jgi:hypothetical protein
MNIPFKVSARICALFFLKHFAPPSLMIALLVFPKAGYATLTLGHCRLSVTFGVCKFILLSVRCNGLNLVFAKQKGLLLQ